MNEASQKETLDKFVPTGEDVIDAAVNHWLRHHLSETGSAFVQGVTDEIVVWHKKKALFEIGALMSLRLSACKGLTLDEQGHFAVYASLAHREAVALKSDAAGPMGWVGERKLRKIATHRLSNVEELQKISSKSANTEELAQLTRAAIDNLSSIVRQTTEQGREALVRLDYTPPTIWGYWWTMVQDGLYTAQIGVSRWMESLKKLRREPKGAQDEQEGS